MMELNKALKFLQNFSIITIGENKVPNFPWKEQQSKKLTDEQFSKNYNYNGGIFRKDGTEIPGTKGFGICTGFDYLEVVDVDTKVFSTAHEQREFWDEFITMLRDNILDFDDKVAIYKTKNAGYHLLYKTKRVEGNLKLAKLKGHKEAVLETRGNHGYVFAYPDNKYSKLSYFDIDFISDEDREVIMHCAKMYNYIEPQEIIISKKSQVEFQEVNLKPWVDYNNKTDIFSLLGDDFTIPHGGNKSKHILVKRLNSESSHSGYVWKDSGCLFLYSTATIFPALKLLTPFEIYAWKKHNGNFNAAGGDLYKQGYGDRVQVKIKELEKSLPKVEKEQLINLEFPIEIYPKPIQSYLLECKNKLDANLDYTGSALLWLTSVCIGNSWEIEVKKGWTEKCTLWISLVGKAGIGKTPSINKVIFPLEQINIAEIKKYAKEYSLFKEYEKLSKKEQKDVPEVNQPKKLQFIANDITVEALVDLHQDSENSVGVFKDELAGWLKDMNKYRAGSDLEMWLSAWSCKSIYLNRISRESSFVDKPFIPVMGGIQPGILSSFYTDENKDNGFMDRMLLSFPDAKIESYNEKELDFDILEWYKESIISFYNKCKRSIKYDEDGSIIAFTATLTDDAKKEWIQIFNKITTTQNSDDENEYLKSMYPKQKSYIPRFALIIHQLECHFNSKEDIRYISKDSMLKAEKLSDYFVNNAKKLRFESIETNDIKKIIKEGTNAEKILKMHEADSNFNKTQVAELLGVSRQYIQKVLKKNEK